MSDFIFDPHFEAEDLVEDEREALYQFEEQLRQGAELSMARQREEVDGLRQLAEPFDGAIQELMGERLTGLDQRLRDYLDRAAAARRSPGETRPEDPPEGYGRHTGELRVPINTISFEQERGPFPHNWGVEQTTAIASSSASPAGDRAKGILGGTAQAFPVGGEGYVMTGVATRVKVKPKVKVMRVGFNILIEEYDLFALGVGGYASSTTRLRFGVNDISGRVSKQLLETAQNFRSVVGVVIAGNGDSGKMHQITLTDHLAVKPGNTYLLYCDIEQCALCGGLVVGAHNIVTASVQSIDIHQVA